MCGDVECVCWSFVYVVYLCMDNGLSGFVGQVALLEVEVRHKSFNLNT